MRVAMEQAEQARGLTGDNPWVGCVIVREGTLLASGHTHAPGEDHAEASAIRQAQEQNLPLEGATLYCTLEPCAFVGRTPACAETIAASGISRVVLGIRDPHPRVNGAGVAILEDAGVEVVEGVLAEPVRQQLQAWLQQF